MTDHTDLIERLREDYCSCNEGYTSRQLIDPYCESCSTKDWRYDAADALEAQGREIERLNGACKSYEIQANRDALRLAEAEREQDTLLGMIRHQRDVLRECLPYLYESMAGRRPGRSADDIRAAVKALTSASADGPKGEK